MDATMVNANKTKTSTSTKYVSASSIWIYFNHFMRQELSLHTLSQKKMPQEKQMANIWVFVVGQPGRCRCDALATEWTRSVNQNEVNAYVWKIRSMLATPFSICLRHSLSFSLSVPLYYYSFFGSNLAREKKRRRQQPFIKCVTSK